MKRVHVVGVGGAGMSAIATILAAQGHRVVGSDQRDGPALDALRALGVEIHVGHTASNLAADTEFLVVSTAIPEDNAEVVEARRRGLPVLDRRSALGPLTGDHDVLAVAGTHGKTTTSALLAGILCTAGADPAFLVGAEIRHLGAAARLGTGRWFVLEADESDGSFLATEPAGAIVTNVEADHLEYHGSFEGLVGAFAGFVERCRGPVVVCADDPGAASLGTHGRAVSYGRSAGATYRIEDLVSRRGRTTWTLHAPTGPLALELAAPGWHHALNGTAAAALALECGVDPASVAAGLAAYRGVARRFEIRGARDGVTYVDDYAHLPTEVRAALSAAADGGWQRVVAVFQPHRYSRTEALWRDFADAFDDADLVVVTDVYSSGEAPRPGVGGKLVVDAVLERRPRAAVAWIPSLEDLPRYLRGVLRAGDVCLTLGAGDLTELPERMLAGDGS